VRKGGDIETSCSAATEEKNKAATCPSGEMTQTQPAPLAEKRESQRIVQVGSPESNNVLCKELAAEIASSAQKTEMLYGRHVRSASWNPSSKSWQVIAESRFPAEGANTEETHTFDFLVLSDKLAFLPNVYAVLEPEAPATRKLVDFFGGSFDGGHTIDAAARQSSSSSTAASNAASSSSSSSAIVLLVALTVKKASASASGDGRGGFDLSEFDGISSFSSHDVLDLVVFENRKPNRIIKATTDRLGDGSGRQGEGAQEILQFVVHSTAAYAAKHMQWDPKTGEGQLPNNSEDVVLEEMWNAFATTVLSAWQSKVEILHRSLFVWDHARSAITASERRCTETDPFYWSGDATDGLLGVCGDFFGDGTVNSAALSGLALADRIVRGISHAKESHPNSSNM
jgi:hypothetical protein